MGGREKLIKRNWVFVKILFTWEIFTHIIGAWEGTTFTKLQTKLKRATSRHSSSSAGDIVEDGEEKSNAKCRRSRAMKRKRMRYEYIIDIAIIFKKAQDILEMTSLIDK